MDTVVREHEHPTSKSVGDNDIPFLDVTICPRYESAYKEDVLESYGINLRNYRSGESFSPRSNATEQGLRALFNSSTYEVDEILKKVAFNVQRPLKPSTSSWINIHFDDSEFRKYVDISTKYMRSLGRCYSIHPKEHIIKLGVIIMDITANLGFYVYFGHPGQFMYSNTKSKVAKYFMTTEH